MDCIDIDARRVIVEFVAGGQFTMHGRNGIIPGDDRRRRNLITGRTHADSSSMVGFWQWGVLAPFAAIGIGGFAFAAGGIIEWSLGLTTFAISMLVADAAHHLGAYARRRQRRREAPPPAESHSFYDFSDYERPPEQRAA